MPKVNHKSNPKPTPNPAGRAEIWGWAMFDFANSSYTTVVITAVYSGYFVQKIVPPNEVMRDSWWALAMVLSTLIALLLSPFTGAICDKSGRKKSYLLASAMICSFATAGLFFVKPGGVLLGVMMITISNAAFMLSESFCAGFLPEIAAPENMGKISGLGWGLGYFGGIASLALTMAVTGEEQNDITSVPFAMVLTGAFFLLSCLPTFLLVKERALPASGFEKAGWGRLLQAGWEELRQTSRSIGKQNVLFRFLIAFTVYMAGLDVVIKFVGIYVSTELAFGKADFAILFLVLQLSAALGAFAFGALESRIGAKRTVLGSLALWVVCIFSIYYLNPLAALIGWTAKRLFFWVAVLAGSGIGSTQSSSRTVVGLLAPPGKSAETFGFWGMFSRLGTILGSSFGLLSDILSRHTALLLVIGFFIGGALLLLPVPMEDKRSMVTRITPDQVDQSGSNPL